MPIARQITEALEAAHERGIIHRDLKPANIIVQGGWSPTPTRWKTAASSVDSPPRVSGDINVKVLDFGLAKLAGPSDGPAEAGHYGGHGSVRLQADLSQSPTMMPPTLMTGGGMILGTAAYMSPEQARGKPVDKRTDIWAFGCVLYEMLTGKRAFGGEDVTDTLAEVIKGEPDWMALPLQVAIRPRLG